MKRSTYDAIRSKKSVVTNDVDYSEDNIDTDTSESNSYNELVKAIVEKGNMREKRKRCENKNNDYDYDDPFIEDDREIKCNTIAKRSRTRCNSFGSYDGNYSEKLESVKKEYMNREITIEKILELNLEMDDYLWFYEHIRMLKNFTEETEERYKIKAMLYNRYVELKNTNLELLSKVKNDTNIETNIVNRILDSKHSDIIKTILYKKYRRIYDNCKNSPSDELFKVIEWIETVLDLPTAVIPSATINGTTISIDEKLRRLWKSLNSNIFGLMHVKEKIMETMCAKLLNPNNRGKILTLVGPPGVGKTAVALSIAQSLDMPFDQISFGSIKDSSTLIGHASTYIGSSPGLFTKILLKSKRLDTLVLLDEIDKIPDTSEGKSISSVLLHVLDKTQNDKFRDMYMPEITIDLSKVIFMLSANSLDLIDPVVRDRMTIINVDGYSIDDKINIVDIHMLPKICAELGFGKNDLKFDRDVIEYIINKTKLQEGMRDIERAFYQILERISLLKHSKGIDFSYKINKISFPLKITKKLADDLM